MTQSKVKYLYFILVVFLSGILHGEEEYTLKFQWPEKFAGKIKINYNLKTKTDDVNRVYVFDTTAAFNVSKENNIYKVTFNDIQVKHKKIFPKRNDRMNLLLDIDSNCLDFCLNDKGEITNLLNYADYKQNLLNKMDTAVIKNKYPKELIAELSADITATGYESRLLLNLQKEWEYLLGFWQGWTLKQHHYYTVKDFGYTMPSIAKEVIPGVNMSFIQDVNKNSIIILKNMQYIPANTLYKILRDKYNISYINFWMHKYRVRTTYYLETNIDTLMPRRCVMEVSIRLPGIKRDDVITYTFDY
jgi:hypothetical protein